MSRQRIVGECEDFNSLQFTKATHTSIRKMKHVHIYVHILMYKYVNSLCMRSFPIKVVEICSRFSAGVGLFLGSFLIPMRKRTPYSYILRCIAFTYLIIWSKKYLFLNCLWALMTPLSKDVSRWKEEHFSRCYMHLKQRGLCRKSEVDFDI